MENFKNKVQIQVNKNKYSYPACIVCLSKEKVYDVGSNKSTTVVHICKECIFSIMEKMIEY